MVGCLFMEACFLFFYASLPSIVVNCRWQWTAILAAVDGNGRQLTAMGGNARTCRSNRQRWKAMDVNGRQSAGTDSNAGPA